MNVGHQIALGLRDAYWAMHRRADSHLARLGVTADQFVLLSILAEADRITQQQLVRRASSDPNTVRAMLLLLEGQKLVLRRKHPTDRRARSVVLTPKGRRTYERLWKESQTFRQQLADLFDADQAERLVENLKRIAEAMSPMSRPDQPSPRKAENAAIH